jgi:hypothetical protein
VAVLLSPAWSYGFLIVPLIVLLFPDGRLGSRWRWPLRAYLAVFVVFVVGTLSVAVAAFSLRVPVDGGGNLVGLSHPSGANAWFGPVQVAGYVSFVLLAIVAVIYQVRSYRRASGERRQQLKWLSSGAAACVVVLVITIAWSDAPAWVGNLFPLALAGLPIALGVAILRYRLYEIDRLISRTLSYAILTALLVGTFIGLIALTTNTLDISSRVGVAASTLAAAALFNPLRRRGDRRRVHRAAARRGRDRRDPRRPARRRQPRRPANPRLDLDQAVSRDPLAATAYLRTAPQPGCRLVPARPPERSSRATADLPGCRATGRPTRPASGPRRRTVRR